jgi:hypothetical protein
MQRGGIFGGHDLFRSDRSIAALAAKFFEILARCANDP